MPLSDDVPTFTLVANFPPLSPDGAERTGEFTFTPVPAVLVAPDGVYLGSETATLVDGGFTKVLVANDAFDIPFVWRVDGRIDGMVPMSVNISVPASAGEVELGGAGFQRLPSTDYVVVPGPAGRQGPAGPDPAGTYLPLAGGALAGSLVVNGTAAASGYPLGRAGATETGLSLLSSFGGEDDGTGTDTTARLNLYSFQRAQTGSFGETIRNFLMRKDSKAMMAWYGPKALFNADETPNESQGWQPWVWTGAHYEANDNQSIHGHWSIEVPDAAGALQTRLEVRFADTVTGVVGLDKTNIATNQADFTVRASNSQVLRVAGSNASNKDIEFSLDAEGGAAYRRWKIRGADSTVETGTGNAGSDFAIFRYDDTGTIVNTPALKITRSSGNVGVNVTTPAARLDVAGSDTQPTVRAVKTSTSVQANFAAVNAGATDRAVDARVAGDSNARLVVYADGKHEWGTGGTRDTNLYRSAADTLKTDDSFQVGGRLTVAPGSAGSVQVGTTDDPTLATITNVLDVRSVDPAIGGAFFKHIPSTGVATAHALTARQAGTSGTGSALNVASDNPQISTVQVSGTETATGTIKVTHHGFADGSDSGASALSIDLRQAGTAAQGIFMTGTDGATTGNLLTLRNNGRDDLVVKATGRVGIRLGTGVTPAGALEVKQADDTTVGLAMTANSGSAQQLLLLKDSGGNSRFEVSAAGNSVHRATAFFTSAVQLGATSADLGGSSGGVLSMKNATTAPTTNPTAGGILYAEGGALKWRGPSGTVTVIGAA